MVAMSVILLVNTVLAYSVGGEKGEEKIVGEKCAKLVSRIAKISTRMFRSSVVTSFPGSAQAKKLNPNAASM